MSAKTFFVICALALIVQVALGQYIPGFGIPALAAPYDFAAPYGRGTPGLDFTPTSGGSLPVSSASAFPPTGIAVDSENYYEGFLATVGELPFVGTVGFEGLLPTAGAGAVNHACGNGINAMVSENTPFAPAYPSAIAPCASRCDGRGYGYVI